MAGRDVAQANGGVLGAALAHKFLVRGAVPFEGLGPAILTGEDIGEVVVEDGQAQTVAELLEPNAGLFFETVDPIQLAEVGEVGQSARTGDGSAQFVVEGFEDLQRQIVELLGQLGATREVIRVGGGAGRQTPQRGHSQQVGQKTGGGGQLDGAIARNANLPIDLGADVFELAGGGQLRPPPKKGMALHIAHQVGHLIEDLVLRFGERLQLHHEIPSASSADCSFWRQRPRMNPIEPVARPSFSATSLYGSGGWVKKSSCTSSRHRAESR